jgi:hypothetical protein
MPWFLEPAKYKLSVLNIVKSSVVFKRPWPEIKGQNLTIESNQTSAIFENLLCQVGSSTLSNYTNPLG